MEFNLLKSEFIYFTRIRRIRTYWYIKYPGRGEPKSGISKKRLLFRRIARLEAIFY